MSQYSRDSPHADSATHLPLWSIGVSDGHSHRGSQTSGHVGFGSAQVRVQGLPQSFQTSPEFASQDEVTETQAK